MTYLQTARQRVEANKGREDIRLLAIETSCDETSAAVTVGRTQRSLVIASQVETHALYGGVVPEIASRAHVEALPGVVRRALEEAETAPEDLDGVAVTYGPGLVGALLCGVSYAKGFAYRHGLPLVPVHHIEGHISAAYLAHPDLAPPFLALVVSGGHSHLVRVADYGHHEILGRTRDDAAGEAFDKAARVLGLPYPGGPAIDRLAREGDDRALPLPRARQEGYNYSFSGLKTALLQAVARCGHRRVLPPRGGRAARGQGGVRPARHRAQKARLGRGRGLQFAAARPRKRGLPTPRRARVPAAAHPLHGQRRHDRLRRVLSLSGGAHCGPGPERRALDAASQLSKTKARPR